MQDRFLLQKDYTYRACYAVMHISPSHISKLLNFFFARAKENWGNPQEFGHRWDWHCRENSYSHSTARKWHKLELTLKSLSPTVFLNFVQYIFSTEKKIIIHFSQHDKILLNICNDKWMPTSLSIRRDPNCFSFRTKYRAKENIIKPCPMSPNMTANRKGKVITVKMADQRHKIIS